MAGENRVSVFGRFGNQNRIKASSPPPIPPGRIFVDYADLRKNHGQIPAPSVFKDPGSKAIEPTTLILDLTNARVDQEFAYSGNILWLQSSTNATDTVTIKYGRKSTTGVPFLPGNSIAGVPFQTLFISNLAIAGATAYLVVLQDSPENPIKVY